MHVQTVLVGTSGDCTMYGKYFYFLLKFPWKNGVHEKMKAQIVIIINNRGGKGRGGGLEQ